jgi:phage tail sheath protein FI
MIFIEQSLKLAARNFVFEPNDTGTWITIKSMMNNFLFNLWKQGALPGSTPDMAYGVKVGLGITMTPADILDGIMRITVLVAVVRPAEFIEITFQQQQQQA